MCVRLLVLVCVFFLAPVAAKAQLVSAPVPPPCPMQNAGDRAEHGCSVVQSLPGPQIPAGPEGISLPGPIPCPQKVVGDHAEHVCAEIPTISVVYASGVTTERTNVEEGVRLGYNYSLSQFGWILGRSVIVFVTAGSGSSVALSSADSVVLNTGNPVWVNASGANRRRIMATAMAEVYLFQVGWATMPAWMRLGAAQIIGWRAAFLGLVVNNTTLVIGHIRMCQVWNMVHSSPALGILQGYESKASVGEGSGATDALSYLAVETLIGEGPSIARLKLVTNFNQLFSSPISVFYGAFENYRRDLVSQGWVPSSNFCEGVQ